MIQTNVLDCPSCGAGLLDPIYDLEMVDGGRRRLTCLSLIHISEPTRH